jgi:hypothetical protein
LSIMRAQFEGAPEGAAAEVLSKVLLEVSSEVSCGAGSEARARLE